MKKWFLLFFLAAASAHAQDIRLTDGRVLHRSHVVKFFAGEFVIEHNGGIAHVAWAEMPASYREEFPLDRNALAREQATVVQRTAAETERLRISRLQRVIVYGKVRQVHSDFATVQCEPVSWEVNDWNRNVQTVMDDSRTIHVSRDLEPLAQGWQVGQQVLFVGREDRTFSYVSRVGKDVTLAHISNLEEWPRNLLVHPRSQSANVSEPSPTPPPNVTFVPAQSKSPNEMELPRYNLETTLDDLKPGITADKARRILGSPLHINGTQWVYRNGYVYVENGVVTALQNRGGDVFASSYGK